MNRYIILNDNDQPEESLVTKNFIEVPLTNTHLTNGFVDLGTATTVPNTVEVEVAGGAEQDSNFMDPINPNFLIDPTNKNQLHIMPVVHQELTGGFVVGQVLQIRWDSLTKGAELRFNTEVQASVGYIEDTDTLSIMAWLKQFGVVVSDPTDISVDVIDQSDTNIVSIMSNDDNGSGVFVFNVNPSNLPTEGVYRIEVTINYGGQAYTTFIPVGKIATTTTIEILDDLAKDFNEIKGLLRSNCIIENTWLNGKIVSTSFKSYKTSDLDTVEDNLLHEYTSSTEYQTEGVKKYTRVKVS